MSEANKRSQQVEWHRSAVDGVTLLIVLALVGVQLYRGLTAGAIQDPTSLRNFGIAFTLLAGVGIYVTPYWRPVLYFLGSIFMGTLTVFWGLREPVTAILEVSRLALGSALVLLFIYLFYRERTRYIQAESGKTTHSSPDDRQ